MAPIALFIRHRTQPGQRDAVRAVWERLMAPAIADNPGHETYVYCYDPNDPQTICAFQQYASPEAASAFLQTDAYRAYEQEVEVLLESPPDVMPLQPLWTKTAPR